MLFVEETMHLALRIPLHAMPLLGNGNNCSSLMLVSVFFAATSHSLLMKRSLSGKSGKPSNGKGTHYREVAMNSTS